MYFKKIALVSGLVIGGICVSSVFSSAKATTTVVTFDDLPTTGSYLGTYDGINWDQNWYVYGFSNGIYVPYTPPNRIDPNTTKFPQNQADSVPFYFLKPEVFNGAFFVGYPNPISYSLYLGGVLQYTSPSFSPSSTYNFFASGYNGSVDQVDVNYTYSGYAVTDNVTYSDPTFVPEPFNILGVATGVALFGSVSTTLKRRKVSK